MHSLQQYQQFTEEGLARLRFPSNPDELYEPVRYILSLGGKRIRPVLTMLACELTGGHPQDALPAALALEVFHNFSLVHDDLMDNASLRRGNPTVHTRWNAPTAILSGDVMLVLAYEILGELPADIFPQAFHLFNESAKRVCEGQQMDMLFENRYDVSIDEYVRMIGLKTAALLACCLKMGALAARAPEKDADLLYNFGYDVGTAFQLQDDLLDSFGSEEQFGKAIGGDIVANKKTYLTLQAFALATPEDADRLDALFHPDDRTPSDLKIREVLSIYERYDIRRITEEARDMYYSRAMAALDALHAPKEGKARLEQLADSLIQREK